MSLKEQRILPARQLNEFVYCPRLFYLEYVDGVFMHNADTLAGKAQHGRVNAKEDGLALKDNGENENIHSRSVSLYSEKLSVTAKLDLVEARTDENGDTRVIPVEYKKGAPREGDDGKEIWDADKMQLGLQILLLRENGFPCNEGVIYYRETRQRVSFSLDAETEQWIYQQVAAARETAEQKQIPPPLDDSPKCPRCSLAPICMPDETRLLNTFSTIPKSPALQLMLELEEITESSAVLAASSIENNDPFRNIPEIRLPALKPGADIRRLIAPNPDTKALYLNTPSQYVAKKDDTLVIKEKQDKVAEFRFNDLHHVALFGPVQISTGAIQALCERDIPLTYFSTGGWFYGMTRGHSLKNVFTRMEQFRQASDAEAAIYHARLFIHGKIRNQRTLLMRNHIECPRGVLKALKHLCSLALGAGSLNTLMGIEGTAASYYFEHFAGMFKNSEQDQPFYFLNRNRRPPRDPINALLSLTYSLLAKDCTLACYAVGFDPYVGFLHQPRFGRPALALDLMEEFRPLVADSTVISVINNRMLTPADFVRSGESVSLTPSGRKAVFQTYEKRLTDIITHPAFGYKVSYRRAIELQARLLAKVLTNEIESYFPFTTR